MPPTADSPADHADRPPIEGTDPFALFADWFAAAEATEPNDPNAMSLATADAQGHVTQRMVLLKDFDAQGFCFYTNTLSTKGRALSAHPQAALGFHWKTQRRAIRIEGMCSPVTPTEADAYFATRPRGSQLGAWASLQSQHLDSRATLEHRLHELEQRYATQPVPRPPHWSGYRLIPTAIEFWQDMPYRLHDRLRFKRVGEKWQSERLYP